MHTTFGFTGQREDTQAPGSSGLDYFNARYYDPVIGRFTSADPTRPDLGRPQGTDAYGYVGGQVEIATDPSGLECDACGGVEGFVLGADWTLDDSTSASGDPPPEPRLQMPGAEVPQFEDPAISEGNLAKYRADVKMDPGHFESSTYQDETSGSLNEYEAQQRAVQSDQTQVQNQPGSNENGDGNGTPPPNPPNPETQTTTNAGTQTTGSTEPTIDIYRGTDIQTEIDNQAESGYVMSDAAREAYNSARGAGASVQDALQEAQAASEAADEVQMGQWQGSRNDYVQAHGEWSQEYSRELGQRSMISFTTDPVKALDFGGTVFTASVPVSAVFPQTLPGAVESEVLILHMIRVVILP